MPLLHYFVFEMTHLFEHTQLILTRLVKCLTLLNENIDWTEFLNKNASRDDLSILKRMRTFLWTDKNIDYSPPNLNKIYWEYYTSLLMKFLPILPKSKIGIISEGSHPLPDELLDRIRHKLSIVQQWLSSRNIPYTLISDTSFSNYSIIIPTCALTHSDLDLKTFKGLVIPDDFWNICFTDEDKYINEIMLRVETMSYSNIPEDELYRWQFPMLHLSTH